MKSQSLGGNFKGQRSSRLIGCTRWTLDSPAFTNFCLCVPDIDQSLVCFYSRIGVNRRAENWVQVLGLKIPGRGKPFDSLRSVITRRISKVGLTSNFKLLQTKKSLLLPPNFLKWTPFFLKSLPCLTF